MGQLFLLEVNASCLIMPPWEKGGWQVKQLPLYRPLINPLSSFPFSHPSSGRPTGSWFPRAASVDVSFSRASSQWILSRNALLNSWNILAFFPLETYWYLQFINNTPLSIPSQNFYAFSSQNFYFFPSQNFYVSGFLKNGGHCVCLICHLNQLLILCII